MLLEDKKIGLVLSGGGAKGAYQVGMFKALEEAGLSKDRLILAGTSIGAANSLTYATGDKDAVREMLMTMGTALTKPADQLADYMIMLWPDELINENKVPVTVCCYSHDDLRAELFDLSREEPDVARKLVLASCALPDYMPPVKIRGRLYTDGGVVPKTLMDKHPGPANKIPLNAMMGKGCDLVIVSYLVPDDPRDEQLVRKLNKEGTGVLELRPLRPLEDRPHQGTLDFRPEKLAELEARGYEETREALDRVCS